MLSELACLSQQRRLDSEESAQRSQVIILLFQEEILI
jgi:hypothetical protein